MNLDEAITSVKSRPVAYVLLSGEGAYRYKGSCRNLVDRLKDHQADRVSKTKNRRPLRLLHFEYFENYTDARKRELYFKSGAFLDF